MAIRKLSGINRWQLIISRGRDQKQVTIPFDGTEVEARAAERKLRGITADESSKVLDLVPAYLSWYEVNRLPRSYGELNDTLKRLLPHFGELPAKYITSRNIEAYKSKRLSDTWQGRTTSRVTINRELKHLFALLRWSADQGTISPVTLKPEYFSKSHMEREARQIDVLSPDELASIFLHLTGPTRILYRLMFWCGLRKKEATRMTVKQIDLGRGMLLVEGKGGKKRPASIPVEILPEIAEAIKGKKPGDLIAANELTGFPYGDLRTPLETAARKAGISKRVHPHGFRHSFGTALALSGASLPEIAMSLGHSPASVAVTMRYIHLAGETLTKQSERIGVWMSDT